MARPDPLGFRPGLWGWGERWMGEVAGKGEEKFWPGTFVSHILAAPRICPHNYVQEVVHRVMHTICLELLGWLSNCIAQRTHCECIFMFDSILPGPHNYVR